ncbi:MAG: DUF4412 domain-containing protein [Chthoniobacterales bacterium]
MKKTLLTLCLLAVSNLAVFADLIVVQEMDQGGPKPVKIEMPMKLKGDKIRMDMGAQASSIINVQSGDVTMLMHPMKSYMTIDGKTVKAMSSQMRGDTKDEDSKNLNPPKATGKKQKINGFDTEEYVTTLNGGKMTLWLAKNVPNQELLVQQFKKLSAAGSQTGGPQIDYSTLPGFPIRIEMVSPDNVKSAMTVMSIQEVTLPDSDFQAPADYKQTQMPTMPK